MSKEDTSGEKSFDPTPQRFAEARKRGDIAKSNDVTVAATYLGLLAVALSAGAWALDRAAATLMVFVAQPDRLEGLVLGPGGAGLLGSAFHAEPPPPR
jgi:flagellar biosynthetic protein FlhB